MMEFTNMNKFLLYIIPFLILSCNQKNDNMKAVSNDSHLTQAEMIQKELDDYDRLDSLSNFAWGNIKFGTSKKDVFKTDAFKDGSDFGSSVRMSYENIESLGRSMNLKESLSHLEAVFQDKELTHFQIKSSFVGRENIEDLTHDCDIFVEHFEEKYGKPSYDKGHIYMTDFQENEEFEYVKFQIHSKFIIISFGETYIESFGFQYYYIIDIDNIDYPTTERYSVEKHEAVIKKWEEQKQKEKEYLNNSF